MNLLSHIKKLLPFDLKHKVKSLAANSILGKSTAKLVNQKVKLPKVIHGCNVIGFANASTGIGESVRACAKAIEATGMKAKIIPVEESRLLSLPLLTADSLKGNLYDINIFHINAAIIEHAVPLMTELFSNRYNIAYWAWELSLFPEKWDSAFKFFNEIWVPSDFVKNAVEKRSPIPVRTMHHAVVAPKLPRLQRSLYDLQDNDFVVLMMFDVSSVLERKNPFAALEAFQKAFSKEDNATLAIKIHNSQSNPDAVRQLKEKVSDFRTVIIDRTLPKEDIWNLLHCSNVYLSLHRSEGFGLIIAEAMSIGKPVVVTGYSGNMDFCSEMNSFPVHYKLVRLKKDVSVYEAGYEWAEPDVDHAAKLLRTIYNNEEIVEEKTKRAAVWIRENLAYECIGNRYLQALTSNEEP